MTLTLLRETESSTGLSEVHISDCQDR